MSDHPARTDPDQQRRFRPSTGAIVNPEPTISDNTTVSYSGVNTPGGLPTQPFQSGLTSSGHTSQNAQQQEIPTTMSWCRRREIANTKPSMDELATEIDDLVESSVASNTWKVYKTAVDSFQNFRQLYDMSQSWFP
jgi:hypothetical protein